MKEIPELIVPAKSVTSGSYGLNHFIEKYRKNKCIDDDNYISNGEFICAVIVLGFKYKTPKSLNLEFYVKNK